MEKNRAGNGLIPGHRAGRGGGAGPAGLGRMHQLSGREDCARSLLEQLTAEGCRAMMVQADVSQRDQVEAMVRRVEETFGPVSLLVNNAGVAGQALFQDISEELWRRYFSVNVDGAFHHHPGGAAPDAPPARRLHREHLLHLGPAGRQL